MNSKTHSRQIDPQGSNAPVPNRPETSAEAARRVEAVAGRVDQFFRLQFERLERVIAECRDVLQREDRIRQLQSELERERDRRHRDYERDKGRIREESRLLREAWDRLEAEQRRLLARRPTPAEGSSQAQTGSMESGAMQPGRTEGQPAVSSEGDTQSEQRSAGAKQATLVEFQQLKREIRKHARRRGP